MCMMCLTCNSCTVTCCGDVLKFHLEEEDGDGDDDGDVVGDLFNIAFNKIPKCASSTTGGILRTIAHRRNFTPDTAFPDGALMWFR